MPPADRRAAIARAAPALALALILAATAFRTWHAWPAVFPGDGHVYLVDTDSYFHLRHASHFPRLVRDDPAFGYPKTIPSDAAGLYDLALGAACKAVGRPARVAAFAPVALFVASALLLFALARRLTTPALAVWAVLAFLLYPGASLPVTTLGYADHHAAEIFCVLTVIYSMHAALAGELSPALAALAVVAFLFTWLGAPIWVAMLAIAAAVVLALDLAHGGPDDAVYRRRARVFALYGATALGFALLFPALYPPLAMHERALRLACVALAALALYAGLHPTVARIACERVSPRAAAALALATPLSCLVAIVALDPGSREVARAVLTPKTSLVSENKVIEASLLWLFWGAPGVLAALALPLSLVRPASRARLFPVLVSVEAGVLWLITRDYAYQTSALMPLLAAVTLDMLPAWPRRALALVVVLPLVMPAQTLRPYLLAHEVRDLQEVDAGWLDAARWLREHGDRSGVASTWDRGNLIAALADRRAVWARYPTVEAARWFSETSEAESLRLLCPDCTAESHVRYVVVDAASVSRKYIGMAGQAGRPLDQNRATAGSVEFEGRTHSPATYGTPWRQAVAVRLYYLDGETLAHYRLVYESPVRTTHYFLLPSANDVARTYMPAGQLAPGRPVRLTSGIAHDITDHSAAKIFEQVRGAIVSGKTAPGAPVELRLELEATNTRRRFTQLRQLIATPDGLWSCIVPYASQNPPGAAVRALGPYAIRTLDASKNVISKSVEVSDEDVLQGRKVQVE